MNPDLARLQPYPFERLARLKAGLTPPPDRHHIPLSIGEPRHRAPAVAVAALTAHLHRLETYPATRGEAALREAGAAWLQRRFALPPGSLDPERHVLPVNGTREALFAIAQCLVDRGRGNPRVVVPNPFYQIYEGAALLAGARPWYVNPGPDGLPDLDAVPEAVWRDCQLLYLCSPYNPTGAVMGLPALRQAIALADRHGFAIASDECYSELYPDEGAPPPGLLQAAADMGREDYAGCLVFHSLSKRSNLPGLRSGLVAGDAGLIAAFHRYRTYHGCAMSPPAQAASVAAWSDETHVRANRARYREKFAAVLERLGGVLDVAAPAGGFYLWPRVEGDERALARRLYAEENVTVLPGRFLSREAGGVDPGAGRLRLALVAPLPECVEAAERIRRCLARL